MNSMVFHLSPEQNPHQLERYLLRRILPIIVIMSLVASIIAGAVVGVVGTSFAKIDFFDWLKLSSTSTETVTNLKNSNEIVRVVTEESAVIDVVKKSGPAVVSIIASQDVPIIEKYYEKEPFSDRFGSGFDSFEFFKNFQFSIPKYRQNGTQKQQVSAGTGFLVSEDGYIATNKHVVSIEGAEYTVIMNDSKKFTATVLARDPMNDIAILKIQGDGKFPLLELGDSTRLQVGQTVITIGYALGKFDNTVSKGVVSGLYRTIDASGGGSAEHLEGIIQTDAAINPGNSGGPLLNIAGQVIGMNTAIYEGSENIGFALPVNDIRQVYESVRAHGKIVRPFLGVRYVVLDEEIRKENNLSYDYGALILRGDSAFDLAVIPGSPADKAGLKENDIILEVDGVKVDTSNSLARLLRNKNIGARVELKVFHTGVEKVVTVILEEFMLK